LTAIHQLIPNLSAGDAIGHHALALKRALRAAGFESEIFTEAVAPPVAKESKPWERYRRRGRADLLLYHSSTGSDMVPFLMEQPAPLAVNYHNITPASFFDRWEPSAANSMRRARDELRQLAPHTDLAVADSHYNAAELRSLGYPEPVVAPLLLDLPGFDAQEPDPATLEKLTRVRERGGAHWLFVGRVAPNKCQHDIVAAFAAYRRLFDPQARLYLAGGFTAQLYRRSLESMAEELGVAQAVELTDSISFAGLIAHYRTADVFVCLSEHEGFCVPVIEAMHVGMPVVAYAAAAVPDTVAGAGVLLPDKDPALVAAAVHRVLDDPACRDELAARGRARAEEYAPERTAAHFVQVLRSFVEERGRG
jgi:glycosyltransferase involved in cell wall biosynthesis